MAAPSIPRTPRAIPAATTDADADAHASGSSSDDGGGDPCGGADSLCSTGRGTKLRIWSDDVEVDSPHVTDWGAELDAWSPGCHVVKLGGQNYSGDLGPVWCDDAAISTQPIGGT